MISLGREPQDMSRKKNKELRSCDRYLSPLWGFSSFCDLSLGLTPQAMNLPPLRGSESTAEILWAKDRFLWERPQETRDK